MRVERVAQVLASTIGEKHLDGLAVPLGDSPRLKRFVGLQSNVFGAHQVGDGKTRGIVREGDEVSAALASGDGRGAPDIGMYLITEALGWQTNAELWHRQARQAL